MILDTNAVSAILDKEGSISRLRLDESNVALPIVVIAEYLFGLAGSNRHQELLADFAVLEAGCRLLQADRATAEIYAEVRYGLKVLGRPIPANDLWIAALALQHDLPILSRDAHFDAVEGVTRVGW